MDIDNKLANLPNNPGVYIMYDADGSIIYIGKAKILKNRVRQYFNKTNHPPKVMRMTEKIHDFKYILTESELDAFALEATLVKKHQPPYNILLKDDKHRPYIRIDTQKQFPRAEITRRIKPDGAKYFGPYMFGIRVGEVLEMLVSAFNLRTCNETAFKSAKRPCINYHIKRCSAPCGGHDTPEDYAQRLKEAMAFLSGKNDGIRRVLTQKMTLASQNEEFETAIRYRDQLTILEKMNTRLTAVLPYDTDADVFGFATNGEYSAISVTTVRGGRMTGLSCYPTMDARLSDEDTLAGFITQYYQSDMPPPDILVPFALSDNDLLTQYLRERAKRAVAISTPQRGVKKDLITNANRNALEYLTKSHERIKYRIDMTTGAVSQLKRLLGLSRLPSRIECYDISNISGTDKVASMVVAKNGEKAKSEYRKFKIKTVEGADDFASMREVLLRRFSSTDSKFSELPDLIVIDGGKGQLSAAVGVLSELGISIDVIGLAKREEEVFKPNESLPHILPRDSFALKLLIRVRDEAHRFAITYHRSLREKRNIPTKKSKSKKDG